jgi:hypothetical protein
MPAFPITGSATLDLSGYAEGAYWVTGWSLAETTSTGTARVRIYDGKDANGSLRASVNLAANDSVRDVLDEGLLEVGTPPSRSLYVQVASGSVEGAIWWAGT